MSTNALTQSPPVDAFLGLFASNPHPTIANALSEKPSMTDAELKKILECIDSALGVYRTNDGKLTALEVSVKSMLTVVRHQVSDQLAREGAASE